MTATAKLRMKRFAIWLILGAFFLIGMRFISVLLGIGLRLSVLLAEIAGCILLLIGMPFFLWIMGEAGFRIFVKPYLRAWHIRRIRNARYMREALERGRTEP